MAIVTLYTKPGCHLCDIAKAALLRVKLDQPFELVEVDIQCDAGLLTEYGLKIPVVSLNNTVIFEYEVNEARLRELIKEVN